MRPWGGGGLEVFAKSKNISNMDMVLIVLYPHSLRIYLGLSNFTFHIIPYHFRFSLNPNPNILQLILWVEGAKQSCLIFIYLTWVREVEEVPWRQKNYESSCLLGKERNCQGKIALPPPFLPFLHFPRSYLWRYNCVWDDLMNVGAEVSENRVVCSESVHFLFFKDLD